MNKLIEFIAENLKLELSNAVTGSSRLQIFFSGPPFELLEQLYDKLSGNGKHGLHIRSGEDDAVVPIFLLDSGADDPKVVPAAAKCTVSYFLQATRNNRNIPVCLALHQERVSSTLSVDSTVLRLGIPNNVSTLNEWMGQPLVRQIIDQAITQVMKASQIQESKTIIEYALLEAWEIDERNRDKRTAWQVLGKLFELRFKGVEPHTELSAILGLPSCEKSEFGNKDQIATLSRVGDFFLTNGLRAGFDELESIATDELVDHVRSFKKHIDNLGLIEASEFAKCPLQNYCPVDLQSGAVADWWHALSVDAWSSLLDVSSEPEPEGRLQVNVVNQVVAVPRGIPFLVRRNVEIEVSICDEDTKVDVSISRSSGNSKFQAIEIISVQNGSTTLFSDVSAPDHDRFLRYKFEADGYSPVTVKIISLDKYLPGVVALCRNSIKATPFKLNRKAKDDKNKSIERYECDLQLPGMGSHQLDLYTSNKISLSKNLCGYEVDSEHSDPIERPINCVDENLSVCLVETDEESYYEFDVRYEEEAIESTPKFRIYLTAEEVDSVGATSEFDRLVIAHRSSAKKEYSNARVESSSCRVANLEEWMLEGAMSFNPLILGPDYLESWRQPDWSDRPFLSRMQMLVDPRPVSPNLTAPDEYVAARSKLFEYLQTPAGEPTPPANTLRLYEYMRNPDFVAALVELLATYGDWLNAHYEDAAWSDVVAIHSGQSAIGALDSVPYALMLTPFHPIRLAWQCRAQDVLQEAIEKHTRCPGASMLNPSSFPDCFLLPCRSATGTIEYHTFAAISTSSDYWSVLWSINDIHQLSDGSEVNHIFGHELGINIDGLASGFSAQQVVRSIDEVSRLMSAKSELRIGISSDSAGAGSCNDGLDNWCSNNLGSGQDHWSAAGARSVFISDDRSSELQPEQAVLASLTTRTEAAVKWFTNVDSSLRQRQDLSIIAHLGTMNHEFAIQGIRSAVDQSGLTRWRVRKQLLAQNATFIAESRIGDIPRVESASLLTHNLLACVDAIETRCRDSADSYVFAPNMAILRNVVERSWYTAVSSANVDAACFFGPTAKAYMWDYELPSYSRRAGENCGYYLLANESPGMILAVRSALSLISNSTEISDSKISAMLEEISRRGMPTLKRLTTGGSMSLGEIGMLVALRFFQAEFEGEQDRPSLLEVVESGKFLNLIMPADPFKNQFEDLRTALENRQGERPDLLVLSIGFESGEPRRLKITPIEVKARGGSMSSKEKKSALSQASLFSEFLFRVQEQASTSELWSIAFRSLVATLLDYGFRVYGQLDQFMKKDEWARQHSAVLRSLAAGNLIVDFDLRGRLINIDGTNTSHPLDLDGDDFDETLVMSHKDAFSLLNSECDEFVHGFRSRLSKWDLEAAGDVGVSKDAPEIQRECKGPVGETAASTSSTVSSSSPNIDLQPESSDDVVDDKCELQQETAEKSSVQEFPGGLKFPVGHTLHEFTEEEVFFYPGNTALNQLNVGVVGDLGTGKTQLIQSLIHQLQLGSEMNRGVKPNILIFDYKKDYSKSAFVEATGARVIEPFDIPLNLFDTRDLGQRRNVWLERAKFFSDLLDKIYSGIGPAQRQKIKTAVRNAYESSARFGSGTPTINGVFDAYQEVSGGAVDSPFSIMSDLVDGGYFVADDANVIPFSEFLEGVVVLDLAEVGQDDRTKNMLVVIFLNLFYDHMLRIEKKPFLGDHPRLRFVDTMLLVDEADNIMKYEFDVLKKILLQGREFGVGVLLASQYLSHFKTSHVNYMEPLLTWFVHKVPSISIKDLEGIGLSNVNHEMVEMVKLLECHECLYKSLGIDGRIIRGKPFFEM